MPARKATRPTRARSAAKARPTPTATPAEPVRLPRRAKGKRPGFFAEPGVDQLFGIATALSAELWAACERIDTLERRLQESGALAPGAIDGFVPDEALAAERARRRAEFIERVFQVLEDYA